MLGRFTLGLVFIRTCIFGLKAVAPICAIYILLRVLGLPAEYVLPLPLELWMFAETTFYAVMYYPNQYLTQRPAVHPPPLPRPEREKLAERCFAVLPDRTAYLPGWFHGAPMSTIKRENVREFLCWAFLDVAKPQSYEQEEEVEGYVCRLQQRLGVTFESGWNPKVRSMRLTLDPVLVEHRPLVWYGIVLLLDICSSIRLWHAGFQHRSTARWFRALPPRPQTIFTRRSPAAHLSYWVRPHTSRTKLPVVFVHGIGIGSFPYVDFLRDVVKAAGAGVGIIFVEIMPVSARICHPPLSREEFCRQITQVLDAHLIDKFTLVANSYGTILATHLLHSPTISPRISSLILIDAVPFLLHLPPVAHNFLHRIPSTANEFRLQFFASRDAGIAHTLSRHVFWAQCILWKEELEGRRVAVVLSGRDLVVDSLACWRYLTGLEEVERDLWCSPDGQLTVLWNAELDHAQVFDRPSRRAPVVGLVEEFVGGE